MLQRCLLWGCDGSSRASVHSCGAALGSIFNTGSLAQPSTRISSIFATVSRDRDLRRMFHACGCFAVLFELARPWCKAIVVSAASQRPLCQRELALHLHIVWMQRYISLRERARAWNLAPMFCGMPTEMMLRVASFAPLAGARMMCIGRGSYSLCDNFLGSIKEGRGLRGDYLLAMRRFLQKNLGGTGFVTNGDLEMQIAAVAELGGDVDLIFALALILKDEVSVHAGYPIDDYWGVDFLGGVCHGRLGPPLYAACGPKGSDAVVSLLIRLGASVEDRRAFVSVRSGASEEESALGRAVGLKKQSTVCLLLRASALTACGGVDRRYRCPDMGSRGWLSALYMAAASGHCGIVKALLGACACPSRPNSSRECKLLSAWEYEDSDHAGALVLEAFLVCERRCCCSTCKYIFKHRDYRCDRTRILSAAPAA